MGKTRKKTAQQFDVLISGEFYGFVDSWTEYLCMERNKDGSVTLTSRSRQILAEAGRYRKRGWLPATIGRKEVWGYDGDYVVGQRLLHQDGDAEITVPQNQFHLAAVDWSPFLRQAVKTHFSLNGELSHGIVTQAVYAGV